MKKARQYWITYSPITNQLAVEAPFNQDLYPSEKIHVREVLDPDPKDEVIKILKEALEKTAAHNKTHSYDTLHHYKIALAKLALAAVEKLEKE